jgi:hypothetical protein
MALVKHYLFKEKTKTKLPLSFLKFEEIKKPVLKNKLLGKQVASEGHMTNQLNVTSLYKNISRII